MTRRWLGGWVLALALSVGSPPARAHPEHWLVEAKLVAASWASGVQGENAEAVGAVLHPEFVIPSFDGSPFSAQHKEDYLAGLGKYPVTKVVLRHARYDREGDSLTVSPVVLYPLRQFHTPAAFSLEMIRDGEEWRIVTITPSRELPEELIDTTHPQRFDRRDVRVSLRDADTGAPIRARVHVRDEDGEYWPPQFHSKNIPTGWREDVGGDVVVGGTPFAYVTPDFITSVPDGRYVMEVARGPEYEPARLEFEVTADAVPALEVRLRRWTHMAAEGWYSGDTHVHFLDPQTAAVEAQGEDLNVLNVLGSSGGDLNTELHQFTGAPSVFSTDDHIVYTTEETRHDFLGHTTLLNLKELIFPMGWGAPSTGVIGGIDYPAMAHQADKAHAQGALVAWAHFPTPYGEVAIDMALDKIDAAEVFVFGDPMEEERRIGPFRTWYRFLNVGIDLPGLGATDKMWNTQIAGGVRTYVKVDGDFTYQSWVDGVEAGRTFVTSGPMLELTAAGAELGDTVDVAAGAALPFRAEVHARAPVDRIEIIVNGEVVASQDNDAGATRFAIEGEAMIEDSSWIAARAYSDEVLPIQNEYYFRGAPMLAHTSPIYLEVDGRPRRSPEDAAFFAAWCDRAISWAQSQANYANDAQREEIVTLFTEAKAFYLEQMDAE
ncbi:MAG: CehA/McbA family metallohydrolase [Caulobacterales bacterium]|nr:CehA/McbA family metallohydrolase [Caulobacterales bacterium]